MSGVTCPKCDSPMRLRTARRGKNAGNQFWGCSRYPSCKEIREFDPEKDKVEVDEAPPPFANTTRPIVINRRFEAKAPDNFHTFFYESATLPKPIFEDIQADRLDEKDIRNFAQWRVDFNKGSAIPDRTAIEDQIISVLEKILTRGRITFPSPEFEKALLKKQDGASFNIEALRSVFLFPSNPLGEELFDSDEEKAFLTEFVASILGEGYLKWIIPQVSLSCLLPFLPDGISGRVDFLLSHPTLERSVVIEIDGAQHAQSQIEDSNRDKALSTAGIDVIRIPASEVRSTTGESLDQLKSILEAIKIFEDEITRGWTILNEAKISHQIQLCLATAMKAGLLDLSDDSDLEIKTDLAQIGVLSKAQANELVKKAVMDFFKLAQNLQQLYGTLESTQERTLSETDIRIYFAIREDLAVGAFHVQDIYLPFSFLRNVIASTPLYLKEVLEKNLLFFLKYLFRKAAFREGQYDAASRLLIGEDTILLLPTGAGKSIAFQLAGLLLPGVTLVVDPIIALIDDQIENLRGAGIERCVGISSQITDPGLKEEVIDLFSQGEFLFTYIAPERFQIESFRGAVKALTTATPVSLIVIDEAHCVSEWGHDFRTAYLNLGSVSRDLCRMDGEAPPLIAMTGTASRSVLKDVQRELRIPDFEAIITPESFDREELRFYIKFCKTSEKRDILKGLLRTVLPGKFGVSSSAFYQSKGGSTYSGLIFCPHVNGDHGVLQISKYLRDELNIDAEFYSGSPPKGFDYKTYNYRKQDVARRFKRDEVPLLVCTKAFGMGIDKPNIRYTIHYNLPPSMEAFYQECGRAGRDRKTSQCVLIVSDDYPDKNLKLLHVDTSVNVVKESEPKRSEADDIDRNLWFQTNAFPGVSEEIGNLKDTINRFTDIRVRSTETIAYQKSSEMRVAEKAVHRLVVLGVVEDYTVDFSANAITATLSGTIGVKVIDSYIKYLEGYSERRAKAESVAISDLQDDGSPEFVLNVAERLINFIYDVIEKGKRRGMEEMLDAAKTKSESALRSRILQYLEQTEFSPILEKLLDEEIEIIEALYEVFDLIVSPQKASELRGQSSRYLESYPDNPGLLIMRGLSEYRCRDTDIETVQTNITAALKFGRDEYGMDEEELGSLLVWTVSQFENRDADVVNAMLSKALTIDDKEGIVSDGRDFARRLINDLQVDFCALPARHLVGLALSDYRNLRINKGD